MEVAGILCRPMVGSRAGGSWYCGPSPGERRAHNAILRRVAGRFEGRLAEVIERVPAPLFADSTPNTLVGAELETPTSVLLDAGCLPRCNAVALDRGDRAAGVSVRLHVDRSGGRQWRGSRTTTGISRSVCFAYSS
jgi:hypothetical protein